ncbi:MAG TPA: hypothetical protein VM328_10230, partial [Fimbriimonadaceae bacterium]|nr:hypothetical protein [Fimbriimonadaceae bacterium]
MNRISREAVLAAAMAGAVLIVAIASSLQTPALARPARAHDVWRENESVKALVERHLEASGGQEFTLAAVPGADGRAAEVRRLVSLGEVQSPLDYYAAGVVLTHSNRADDLLLAHD